MINLFTFTRLIDGELYEGRMPAVSWQDAQQSLSDGVINGMLIESRCATCLGITDAPSVSSEVIEAEFEEVCGQ